MKKHARWRKDLLQGWDGALCALLYSSMKEAVICYLVRAFDRELKPNGMVMLEREQTKQGSACQLRTKRGT